MGQTLVEDPIQDHGSWKVVALNTIKLFPDFVSISVDNKTTLSLPLKSEHNKNVV